MIDLSQSKVYEFDDFRLDAKSHRLYRRISGELLPLTPKAVELLLVLVESGGRVLTKHELLDTVWDNSFVEESNLSQTIFVLRKTLGENTKEPRFILTAPNRGYQFIARVKEIRSEDKILDEEILADTSQVQSSKFEVPSSKAENQKPKTNLLWFAVPLALLLTLGIYWFYSTAKPADLSEIRTIAILPFEDVSVEQTEKYLGVSLADALVNKFSGLRQIVVRPTRTVLKYADSRDDAVKIGRELQVDAVLDGRIQRSGDRLRVSVQVIRTSDNATIWTENFDDQFTNFFAVQDSISQKVASSLLVRMDENERRRFLQRGTANPEAYQDYLRGRFFWNKRNGEDFKKAIVQFEQAAQKDPNFALAYAGLADCYALMPLYAGISANEAFPPALEYANRALQIDEQLAEVHTTLGYINQHSAKPAEAERAFKRAIELNPNYPQAHHWYSRLLRDVKRLDEALVEINRASELDPTSVVIMINTAQVYKEQGNYDAAIEVLGKMVSYDPHSAHDELARVYLRKGLPVEALPESLKAVEFSSRYYPHLITLGEVYIKLGRRKDAINVINELEEKYPAASSYYIALLYAQLGEKERVFDWLERAIKEKHFDLLLINDEPSFEPYRAEARFQELLRRMGL